MRALAHPVRLAILSRLQGYGPSTATALAPLVGATPSVTSWHLRHLAEHGLVRDADVEADGRQRWWEAAGTRLPLHPAAPTTQAATPRRCCRSVLFDAGRYRCPAPWAPGGRAAPRGRVAPRRRVCPTPPCVVTADELAEVEAAIEAAARALRAAQGRPRGRRPVGGNVRMLRYVLPEADLTLMSEVRRRRPSPTRPRSGATAGSRPTGRGRASRSSATGSPSSRCRSSR